jgi:hypothetical protein
LQKQRAGQPLRATTAPTNQHGKYFELPLDLISSAQIPDRIVSTATAVVAKSTSCGRPTPVQVTAVIHEEQVVRVLPKTICKVSCAKYRTSTIEVRPLTNCRLNRNRLKQG